MWLRWDQFVEAIRRRAVAEGPDGPQAGTLEGMLGLGPVRARRGPAESVPHHAGHLSGSFLQWLHSTGARLERGFVRFAGIYFAAVAVALEQGRWDPTDPGLAMHTHAMIEAERNRGTPASAEQESLLASWLMALFGIRPGHDTNATITRQRRQRQDLLFPDGPS